MAAKWQKITIKVPKELNPTERVEVADLVIEHIVDRTDKGLDKNGNKFAKYSKGYINSLDFKNARKSPSKVDIQLSGDTIAALKLLNHKPGEITVGFERGSEENAKADGNIRGTYGQSSPIPGKQRDFLGIEKNKLKELVKYVSGNETT